uniref:26S proteasome non-ATPase regulatory subunit 2 n=1 Tax=Steinernema glaseri TaxID=37863 RepID=A0A1I8AAV1_9BILA
MYLLSCAPLTPDPDNQVLIKTSKDLYLKFGKLFEALRCAIMLNDVHMCRQIFMDCQDRLIQKQMAILLGRHQIFLELEDVDNADKLIELNSNSHLHHYFLSLCRELDIMEPKTPEGIYKSHLEPSRPFGGASSPESARMNLAAAFVNGFVNSGFSVDKMMAESEEANRWFYKNKEYGMLTSAASQGLVWRWNIDAGLSQCDRFLYVDDDYIKAGTLLAIGIISSGIQDTCDPASALLIDHVHSDRAVMRVGSIFGLGLAYANSKRNAVLKEEETGVVYELKKVLSCTKPSGNNEVKGLAGLSLGFVLVGTADGAAATEMLQLLMEKSSTELADPNMRFIALGLALIFLGTQEKSDTIVESLRSLPDPFGSMVSTLVEVCAYAGTGNVLKIQKLLHICSEHYEVKEEPKKTEPRKKSPRFRLQRFPSTTRLQSSSSTSLRLFGSTNSAFTRIARPTTPTPDKQDPSSQQAREDRPPPPTPEQKDLSSQQAVAVLGIGLIAMGEEIGTQMSLRTFGHLMRYGEPVIRRAVPLALALVSVSNPQLNILETLSKYTHDADADTAHNAIFALGLVGAGTNNARLVSLLRQLASYHRKDTTAVMLVRIAQGLTHLGKGTMTLNPFHSDRQLMCPAAVAGLFATCFAFLDGKTSFLNHRRHYLLYSLVPAMQPRHLITLIEDEDKPGNLKEIGVTVRVGQAVDVVAQVGKPKTITGFQTHTTPVLLAYGERAELATDEYIPLSPYLEGLIILKKNPEFESATRGKK